MKFPAPRIAPILVLALGICAVAAGFPAAAGAQASVKDDRCFACHAGAGLGTVMVNGVGKSLTLDHALWNTSLHSLLDCTSCHIGFKPRVHTLVETADWYQQATLTACGNCHAGEFAAYGTSVHGRFVARNGVTVKAPTCGACHNGHATVDVASTTARQQMVMSCESCHGGNAQSFRDTYHGQAFALGDSKTAVCVDCHGSHTILPASDPASSVAKQNLVRTCSKCHSTANASFVTYMVHSNPANPSSSLLLWLSDRSHLLLIGLLFAFGALHCSLYFYRGMKEGMYLHGSKH